MRVMIVLQQVRLRPPLPVIESVSHILKPGTEKPPLSVESSLSRAMRYGLCICSTFWKRTRKAGLGRQPT
jgi:hypothetical protein